jgi:anti-anti-sigma factor
VEPASTTLRQTAFPSAYAAGSTSRSGPRETTAISGELRLEVSGPLDRRSAGGFVQSLRALEMSRPSRLTIDLRGCSFLDVVGACVLLDAARRARRDGRRLALAGGSRVVLRMLHLTAVDRVVELEP